MSTLKIEHLISDHQGQVILNDLSLTLQQGEIVALLGPSGCGKTTLLRAIAGLQAITQGNIQLNGRIISSPDIFVPSESRGIGMIFQDYALFPHLNVADNILFGVQGLTALQKAHRLEEMLSLVKLEGLAKRYPHELSGGQQQRVSIARALAYEPDLLLLDEPFSNIDAQVRDELMAEIRQILKARDVSAVFVTHSKDEAFVFADKLALFHHGAIVQHGTPETLFHTPVNRYVADFLGQTNYLDVVGIDATSVHTSFGPVLSRQPVSLAPQQRGQLLLRPQQIAMSLNDNGPGRIIYKRFLGNVCDYVVSVGNSSLAVRSQSADFVVEQRVELHVAPHDLVLF